MRNHGTDSNWQPGAVRFRHQCSAHQRCGAGETLSSPAGTSHRGLIEASNGFQGDNKQRAESRKLGPCSAIPREAAGRAQGGRGSAVRRMQGPRAALILSAGELRVRHPCSTTWYRLEGGPVCNWPPQPPEPRTSYPVPWPWARHSEIRPPKTLPWPRPASAWSNGARAGGKSLAGSRAIRSLAHGTHARGTADLRPRGPPHTPARDDAPLQDGEAHWGQPTLARGSSDTDEKTGGREKSDRGLASG